MVNGFQYHHPHDSHVTLGKLLNVSKPQFSHAKKKTKKGCKNRVYFTALCEESVRLYVRHFGYALTHNIYFLAINLIEHLY